MARVQGHKTSAHHFESKANINLSKNGYTTIEQESPKRTRITILFLTSKSKCTSKQSFQRAQTGTATVEPTMYQKVAAKALGNSEIHWLIDLTSLALVPRLPHSMQRMPCKVRPLR
eukprot:285355-Amphidinium_carterae.1